MIASIKFIRRLITLVSLLLIAHSLANAQLAHDPNALFKNELRAECFEKYGTDPGCGEPLERWMRQIDSIVACQVNYAKGLQRINETLSIFHKKPEGYEFPEWRFGNVGVTQYVVPQLAPFHDYDIRKYPTLSASLEQHRSSGVDTMKAYIAEVAFLHWFDNFFRGLARKPPRPPLAPPTFIN
jgi:hypothetical protein